MRLLSRLLLPIVLAVAGLTAARGQTQLPGLHIDERMPVFPGADSLNWRSSALAFSRFLQDSLRVPRQAVRDEVAGQVVVSFTVAPDGHTTSIRLVKGLRADVDSAVLGSARRLRRVRWRPGTQAGRPVAVSMSAPVNINLPAGFGVSTDSLDLPRFTRLRLPTTRWNPARPAPAGAAVLYGTCLQRLGFSSGGLDQHVRVVNLTTGQVFRLNVKPFIRSRRENPFCYALPAGRYALSRYEFGNNGFDMREEHLRRPLRRPAGAGAPLAATRFEFVLAPGRVHYVGTWNFANADEPLFLNEKALLDPVLLAEYPGAPLADAVVALPQ